MSDSSAKGGEPILGFVARPIFAQTRRLNTVLFMDQPTLLNEGHIVDDAGYVIYTKYVNLEPSRSDLLAEHGSKFVLPTLVKGCKEEHAIDKGCPKILVSRPGRFREDGFTLIQDQSEALVSQEFLGETQRDNPLDLNYARWKNEIENKAAELTGVRSRKHTTSTESTPFVTHIASTGRNLWMWSSSIEPVNTVEWNLWRESLCEEYDHVTRIHSPRKFARALGVAASRKLSPLEEAARIRHEGDVVTSHPAQTVLHGPVVYIDNRYNYVYETPSGFDRVLRLVFSKEQKYQYQKEYRFVIWSDEQSEPLKVFLDVPPEMLAAVGVNEPASAQMPAPTILLSLEGSISESGSCKIVD